jgi:predicted transcriptional regulator
MSKITFRADDDLVERLEALDTSKSEVMREALRAYLDSAERREHGSGTDDPRPIDDALAARIDDLVADRLDDALARRRRRTDEMSVTVTVDGVRATDSPVVETSKSQDSSRKTPEDEADDADDPGQRCGQCGESIDSAHVYCPNCGEKSSHRAFCECGDEIRSDWAFCPGCGRRTPAADVLDRS